VRFQECANGRNVSLTSRIEQRRQSTHGYRGNDRQFVIRWLRTASAALWLLLRVLLWRRRAASATLRLCRIGQGLLSALWL
jgi:hypothetical protein